MGGEQGLSPLRWDIEDSQASPAAGPTTHWASQGAVGVTDSVTAYISKCIDDVIWKVNVMTFPNQKPWAKLKAQSSAYSSGDLEALRRSRYNLHHRCQKSLQGQVGV